MSQGTFLDTVIPLEAFERIFIFRARIEFIPRGKSTILVKNDQILKSAFLTCLCP